jgi:DNA-binding transcriptional ArsR family regulator
MQSVFEVVAEPTRRSILNILAKSQRSVADIEAELGLPQTTVSKHLRVLREAGVVVAKVDAQRRLYSVTPGPLKELDDWLAPFRELWQNHLDAFERHLDRVHGAAGGLE